MSAPAPERDELLITFTLFKDTSALEKELRADVPWSTWVAWLRAPATYISKEACKLVSLSEFGETGSDKNSLRHAANVLRAYGGEGDYDGEKMPIEEAAALLQNADIRAVFCTSASHTRAKPRWHVFLPFSEPTLPERRAEYVARANRILGGVLKSESFSLSQSFYIGRVRGVEYVVIETTGRCVDLAYEIEPLYAQASAGKADERHTRNETPDAEYLAAFECGKGRHEAMLTLSGRWAMRGAGYDDIVANFKALFDKYPGVSPRNDKGIDLRTEIKRIAASAVAKFKDPRTKASGGNSRDELAKLIEEMRTTAAASLAQMCTTPVEQPEPLVRDLLYPGAWLLVGRPKIGKSYLLLQIALGVAKAGEFLGFTCEAQSSVLCVFAEDNDARLQKRLAALGVASPPANVYLFNQQQVQDLAEKFADASFVQFLDVWLDAHPDIRLVLVDTETVLRQIWPGPLATDDDQQVTESAYRQTRVFDVLALRRGIVVLLVNHARKRSGELLDIHELINRANTAMAGASGSIALADPPDADPLDPTQKMRILGIRGRDLDRDIMLAVHQGDDGMPGFVCDGAYVEVRGVDARVRQEQGQGALRVVRPAGRAGRQGERNRTAGAHPHVEEQAHDVEDLPDSRETREGWRMAARAHE